LVKLSHLREELVGGSHPKKKKRVPGEGDFPLFSMRSPGTIIYISGEGKYTKT